MKSCARIFSVLSATTLLGCAQPSLAPAPKPAVAAATSRVPSQLRVQPVESISSPVSEVEGLFIMGRSAHGSGQLALAEERYAQVLEKQAQHLGALNSMAVIYAQTGRIDKALAYFKQALEVDPKASHVHNNFGYALMLDGRLAEAEAELRIARDLSPSSLQTGQNLDLLARTRERAKTSPQLVAVAPNVYELRDRSAAALAVARAPDQTQVQPKVQVQSPMQAQVMARQMPAAAHSLALVHESVASASLQGVRIEVSNGVGIRYLARRTAERLSPTGLVTARLTNQPGYHQSKTEIQFGAGQKMAAEALSSQFPVAVKTVSSISLIRNIQLRLVLGHDLVGKAIVAWLESGGETRVALGLDDGWRWS